MFEAEIKEKDNGIEYYEYLPDNYIKVTDLRDLFKLKEGETRKTLSNLEVDIGKQLIIYNPYTKEYYPRMLDWMFDRKKYNGYIEDGNLYMKK